MAHESDASMGTLVRGVLEDVRDLFREEVALARVELRQELSRASSAATGFGAAAVTGWFGAMFILTAIAIGAADLLGWPLWAGFGIVGVLLAVIAGVLFMRGRSALREVRGLPRTVATVKETFQ